MANSPEVLVWDTLIEELCRRFGGLTGIDIVEEFNKLIHEDEVSNYQREFEEMRSFLLSENSGLTERYVISSVISGLKKD